jgi:membrane protease YdiL (CAAX protease family)
MTRPEFLPPRPPEPSEAPPEEPRGLPLWAPFATMAAVFVIVSLVSIAVIGIAVASDSTIKASDPPESLTLVLTVVQDAVLVLAAALTLKLVLGRVAPSDLGVRPVVDWRRALKVAAACYAAYWVVATFLSALFKPPEQQIVTDLKTEHAAGIVIGFAVLTCVVAPICEELFFRGFMFAAFARRLGPRWAALIAGAIFGLVHAPNPAVSLIALGVLGVCLCALFWRTQSIIPCMALHALNNSISFGVTKSLGAGAFAALVVGSVGLVVALASVTAARSAVAA